jgi:outer membrane lipoprotein-sorting protein
MKRALTIIVVSLIFSAIAAAQTPAPDAKPNVTVDQVLDKYVEAIGGKAALEKLTTRVAKGTFEITAQGVSAPAEVYAKAPNSLLIKFNINGYGLLSQGYNGSIGWAQDPQSGLREITGAELDEIKRSSDFYHETRLKELYAKLELKGTAKAGDRDAYVIEATPKDGSVEKYYFDVQSGLLIRIDGEQDSPQGKLVTETYYENYKDVDGIKLAFTTRQVVGNTTVLLKFTEIKHNVPIDDATFNKPSK